MGKNFDGTGARAGFSHGRRAAAGLQGNLRLQTRLNGKVDASTDDMVFDVETLISVISEGITLEPGDLIITGTPAGVGLARKPPLFMKPGDVCEVDVEGIGVLVNPVAAEPKEMGAAT
jgi:2-keto-4-pentenoate hydratase/2-oxohepta-3-ene-1,7-dioic acid hydratase in catechol pathway